MGWALQQAQDGLGLAAGAGWVGPCSRCRMDWALLQVLDG